LVNLRSRLPVGSLTAVRYEAFVRQPRQTLSDLCQFVGIEAHDAYLEACAGIVKPLPDQSRQMVAWTPRWIGIVRDRISQFDFLADYTYEN
jgi:hypothetical protein